ncbi:heptaprenyl diphosphate synthase component 1 [Paenibacillus bovis]|uniref:Heptaprenyl diphosphate synthase n=1 Tax=Paenibacillus bovis TaxID=1616788 RepID=A0A172ZIU6_9BACL|nr:heptaprenyl diphosphate synthase component 1 [Paenibacillus bovis]ANF97459.1 hypothetical protein AR543_16565 [Paenibacillus bovis]
MKPYRLLETSQKYTDYDMIQEHTAIPEFPDIRARLLLAFLNEAADTEQKADRGQLFSLVTGLVQMALDTHDRIDTSPLHQEEAKMRSRQLNVLAGDYFSSRFYELLAKAGEIQMVSRLSEAICENNRLKMNLYQQVQRTMLTSEQYIEAITQLKMQLFLSFKAYLPADRAELWEEMLYAFSRCEVLAEDMQLKQASLQQRPFGHYSLYYALEQATQQDQVAMMAEPVDSPRWQQWYEQYGAVEQIGQLLEQSLSVIQSRLQQPGYERLRADVAPLTEVYATLR